MLHKIFVFSKNEIYIIIIYKTNKVEVKARKRINNNRDKTLKNWLVVKTLNWMKL